MKRLFIFLTLCAFCASSAFAADLLTINFESPDYSTGELAGQQMWSPYPGFSPPDAQVVTDTPTPVEGSQCARLISTNDTFCAEMYDARGDINDSTFNTNTHYLRVAMEIFPRSNYDACDLRIDVSNRVRLVLFGIWTDGESNAVANLNGTEINTPVTWGEWHEVSVLLDCINQQVIQFTADELVFPVTNRPFWAQAAYPQMVRISCNNALDYWAAFDAISVTSEPIPEPGFIGLLALGLLLLKRR
jgi:hypothetical protein